MTEEVTAGQMLGLTQETEAIDAQGTTTQIDTPVDTDTPCEDTHQITTEHRADHT